MAQTCILRTAWDAKLWADAALGGIVFAQAVEGTDEPDHPPAVLLAIPDSRPGVAFLVTSDGHTPLRVGAALQGGPVLPVRLRTEPGGAGITLWHPYTGAPLSTPPPDPGTVRGTVITDRAAGNGHLRFTAGPAPAPGPELAALLAWMDRIAATALNGPAILALLASGLPTGAGPMLDAYARLLPPDQLAWLAAALLRSAAAREGLAATFPSDAFATEALPALARWEPSRPAATCLETTPAQGDLSVAGQDGVHVSFPHLCSSLARRTVAPRRTVAVLATARNEGLYLLEWIAHHRLLGMEHAFIYSNDNSDGSDALLGVLARAGVITWIANPVPAGRIAQFQAYGHAFGMLPHVLDYRWTLVLDLDELLCLDPARFASLPDHLAWQEAQPVDAVAFNWVIFGSGGEARWRDAPMSARFGQRMPYTDHHVKTAVRTGLALHAHPHRPVFDARQAAVVRDALGAPHRPMHLDPSLSAQPDETAAWVSHYYFKSAEEFAWKASRNRGDQPVQPGTAPRGMDTQAAEMFLSQHGSPALLPDTRSFAAAAALQGEMARLLALPGVFQAMQAIRFLYADQAGTLRRRCRAAGGVRAAPDRRGARPGLTTNRRTF